MVCMRARYMKKKLHDIFLIFKSNIYPEFSVRRVHKAFIELTISVIMRQV